MPFRTLLSLSSWRDKTHYSSPINVKQSSFFRSHKNEFYDLLTIPSCTSSTTNNAKGMENSLIFHVTIQIQILTMFSVQSKYSKKTKSISLLGFVISNKTCKTQWIHLTTDVRHFSQMSYFHTPTRGFGALVFGLACC